MDSRSMISLIVIIGFFAAVTSGMSRGDAGRRMKQVTTADAGNNVTRSGSYTRNNAGGSNDTMTYELKTLKRFPSILHEARSPARYGTAQTGSHVTSGGLQQQQPKSEYCDTEVFRAECSEGHVIILDRAVYGRMRLGRCVEMSLGYIGCSADVIHVADRRCSGRRLCEIRIPDAEFEATRPCLKELKTYLEATYRCVKVESVTSEYCKTHDELDVTLSHLTQSGGYIASVVTSDTPHCEGASHPWVIHALSGQRVQLVLYDFAATAASTVSTSGLSLTGGEKTGGYTHTAKNLQLQQSHRQRQQQQRQHTMQAQQQQQLDAPQLFHRDNKYPIEEKLGKNESDVEVPNRAGVALSDSTDLDFGLIGSEHLPVVKEDEEEEGCSEYGLVKDSGRKDDRPISICGGTQTRVKVIYQSIGNVVRIWATAGTAPTDLKRFVIKYSVFGCADPDIADDSWMKRTADGDVIVGCHQSNVITSLKCVDNILNGTMINCSAHPSVSRHDELQLLYDDREPGARLLTHIVGFDNMQDRTLTIAVLIAVSIGIVLVVGLVIILIKITRQGRSLRDSLPLHKSSQQSRDVIDVQQLAPGNDDAYNYILTNESNGNAHRLERNLNGGQQGQCSVSDMVVQQRHHGNIGTLTEPLLGSDDRGKSLEQRRQPANDNSDVDDDYDEHIWQSSVLRCAALCSEVDLPVAMSTSHELTSCDRFQSCDGMRKTMTLTDRRTEVMKSHEHVVMTPLFDDIRLYGGLHDVISKTSLPSYSCQFSDKCDPLVNELPLSYKTFKPLIHGTTDD